MAHGGVNASITTTYGPETPDELMLSIWVNGFVKDFIQIHLVPHHFIHQVFYFVIFFF